ncbi:MAG: DDE-type integrase/transposase/recombinase [Firmicutes bacterium]|nr:DDE-type integrase/transposase/recombinase [Bacillota bacterium]
MESEGTTVKLVVPYLLMLIKFLNKILFRFQCYLVNKFLQNSPSDNPVSEKYRVLRVDAMPIIEKRVLYDYRQLLSKYLDEHGKPLKPVNRRSKYLPPPDTVCPICSAPYEYIYDNAGGRGQLGCKVCKSTFYPDKAYLEKLTLKCPHCGKALQKKRDRKNFFVYSCVNRCCPFYVRNLTSMSTDEKADFVKNPYKYKLHYYYRVFDINLDSLKKDTCIPSAVDLSRIRNARYVLGLVLTYHVNYGLSTRQTASILWDVHNIKISHQTVSNYAASAARVVKPFVDDYPYALSNSVSVCGDETYVKILGKRHYVFFMMDTIKKIITSYSIFFNRDGVAAIKTIYSTLSKFSKIPEDLTLIFDGNPIYALAQHFFAQHGICFDVKQVIGLTNRDEVSKEYRWLKQVIERLNRSFKGVYKGKNGFNSFERANEFMALFAAFFIFLRRHQALSFNVPVSIPELEVMPDMPSKWLKLLRLSYDYLENLQKSA